MTQKQKILSSLAKFGKSPEDMMSLKELTAILTLQTKYSNSTPPLTAEQVKVLYKVTDPAGSNSAPCELIAATWSHEPLDRALLMRNTFRTCDFDQSGAPRRLQPMQTHMHAHAHAHVVEATFRACAFARPHQARSQEGVYYGSTYWDDTY